MVTSRGHHCCIVLKDKDQRKVVLVVGGYNGNYLKTTELFDIASQKWSPGPDMSTGTFGSALVGASPYSRHAAFLVGGAQNNGASSKILAINQDLNEWEELVGSFNVVRSSHAAVQLTKNMVDQCLENTGGGLP